MKTTHVILLCCQVFFVRVFANAETLFYYAREARPTNKPLSREEIEALLAQTSGKVDKKSELSEEEEEDRQQRRESATLGEDAENEVTPFDEVNDTISDDELHIERKHNTRGLPLESGPSDLETLPPENNEAAEEETNLVPLYPDTLAGSVPLPLSSSSDIYLDRLPLVEDSVTSEGMD